MPSIHLTSRRRRPERRGATLVEMAVTLPVFAVFLAGLLELNHAYMAVTTLQAATRQAARMGATGEMTTDEVETATRDILGSTFQPAYVEILIKDASAFDSDPEGGFDIDALPAIDLATAEPRTLFVVRAEVDYSDISMVAPFFVKGTDENGNDTAARLSAQSVMRHE
ncbi:MAG: TadE family protein [Planctomycetota bacterium]